MKLIGHNSKVLVSNGKAFKSNAEKVIEPLSVTENGTYTAPSGVDGYSPVTVAVPGEESQLELLVDTEFTLDEDFTGTAATDLVILPASLFEGKQTAKMHSIVDIAAVTDVGTDGGTLLNTVTIGYNNPPTSTGAVSQTQGHGYVDRADGSSRVLTGSYGLRWSSYSSDGAVIQGRCTSAVTTLIKAGTYRFRWYKIKDGVL